MSNKQSPNVVWHQPAVNREDRIRLGNQRGAVLWFTGFSGSGKSTIASAAEHRLNQAGKLTYLLDGDNVRMGLCADLGFSAPDRKENNRRMAHLARLFWDANVITFVSFISPFRKERDLARGLVGGGLPGNLRGHSAGGLRKPRPQGPVRPGPQGRDRRVHRHLLAL